jgi:putative transposase
VRGDRRAGERFPGRPIEDAWPYLWIDATYVKVREAGRIVSMATIVAVGVNTDGRREVLGVTTGPSEAEPFWKAFLRSLADRGLRGVRLVVADDHKGLRAAAAKVFSATHQRCRVPLGDLLIAVPAGTDRQLGCRWLRNALAHAPPKQRPAAVAMLKTIFAHRWQCHRSGPAGTAATRRPRGHRRGRARAVAAGRRCLARGRQLRCQPPGSPS